MPAAAPQLAQGAGSSARINAEMERMRAATLTQQAKKAAQDAALKASGSAGYGQQQPRAASPQPGWLRQRHAEQKALTATVTAALRAWPGRGYPPVFRHVAEAFAFIDADGEGGISEFELGKGPISLSHLDS